MAKNRSSKGRRSAQKRVDAANVINACSKAFSSSSLRGISPTAGKHKISLSNSDGSKRRINYDTQTIKCKSSNSSGLRPVDLMRDNTGRAEKSKASLRFMQAHIGASIDDMSILVDSLRDCADLVDTGETIDNVAIYRPNASLQAIYDESKRADVRGIKFDNDANKVLLVKRTKKGTSRKLVARPVKADSIIDATLRWTRKGLFVNNEFDVAGTGINFIEIDRRDVHLQDLARRKFAKSFDKKRSIPVSVSLAAHRNFEMYCAALVELAFESLDS